MLYILLYRPLQQLIGERLTLVVKIVLVDAMHKNTGVIVQNQMLSPITGVKIH